VTVNRTYGQTLIDRAIVKLGTSARVARAIGVSTPALANWRNGKSKLPPERAALLADVTGENALVAASRVMQENADAELATRLQKAFFVALATGAGATLLTFASAVFGPAYARGADKTPEELTHTSSGVDRLYIVAHRVTAWLARALSALRARSVRLAGRPLQHA